MKFQIKCVVCGETVWIRGTQEYDTNYTSLDDNDPNWSDACSHIRLGGDWEFTDGQEFVNDDEV